MNGKIAAAIALSLACGTALGARDISCHQVGQGPVVDGDATDPVWEAAPPASIRDAVADLEHSLRCLYTNREIFLLAEFPDATENRVHKRMVWDAAAKRYRTGPRREDTLVLKWSMEPEPVDLSLRSDQPYKADIWYWKSARTDHGGFADDKFHLYTNEPLPRARRLISKSGRRFYLLRRGNHGQPAYRVRLREKYDGEEVEKFYRLRPQGSRADVRARGRWSRGQWQLELSRDLQTGHPDDVQFDAQQSYQFGLSRYEIAGRGLDPDIEIPQFGAGDVGETLRLVFKVSLTSSQ